MAQYVLYGYWRSSCSYRVRIALNHKGLAFENSPVHLVKDGGCQHFQKYRELNPMRQVPCLVDATHDRILNQSTVIMDYLDQQHPQPPLYPKDAYDALHVREMCELVNSGIQPLQNLSVLQEIEKRFQADAAGKAAWAAHFIRRGFQALEAKVKPLAGSYCFGDSVSAADMCLIPQVYGAQRFGVDMDDYPTLKRINENCLSLEAFQQAEPAAQPDAVK